MELKELYGCIGLQAEMVKKLNDSGRQVRLHPLVQRILSNWQFDLFISLIALLPKPRRSHRYACVCEAALSGKYSASNYPKLNFRCTSADSCGLQVSYAFCKQNQENFFSKPVSVCLGVFCKTKPAKFRKREYPALEQRERRSRKGSADFDFAEI